MWMIKLALRNARRNVRRTLLTASTVVIGVALFTFAMSWINGAFSDVFSRSTAFVGHLRVVDPDYAAREQLMPLYENLADVAPIVEELEKVPGVRGAYPVITSGVGVVVGDAELGDAFGLAKGAPWEWLRTEARVEDALVDGRWPEGDDDIVLGKRLAAKAGARVGDEVLLFGTTQDGSISPVRGTLVGILGAGSPVVDQSAFISLATAQRMLDLDGGAIEVLAYTDDFDHADVVAEAARATGAFGDYELLAWNERAPYAEYVAFSGAIQGILAGFLVFLTSLAIWNTMTMSVLERTGEIGVMRAMGLGRFGAVGLFVVEAAVIAAIGGAVGVGLGAIPSMWLEQHGLTFGEDLIQRTGTDFALSTTMYADLDATVMLKGFAVGLMMAIVGSLIPSLRAATIQPVEAMRHGR